MNISKYKKTLIIYIYAYKEFKSRKEDQKRKDAIKKLHNLLKKHQTK